MSRVSVTIEITVQPQALVFVTPLPLALSVEQGMTGSLPITVRNSGSLPITYTFVSTLPEGLAIVVLLEDNVYTRTVAPGSEDTMEVLLHVGTGVPPAAYSIGIDLN